MTSGNSGQALLVFEQESTILRWNGWTNGRHGTISDAASTVRVVDVQHYQINGQPFTLLKLKVSFVTAGANYKLEIWPRRHRVAEEPQRLTSCTFALHNIVGDHAVQAGSCRQKFFAFQGFAHFEAVTQKNCVLSKNKLTKEIMANSVTTIETNRPDLLLNQ